MMVRPESAAHGPDWQEECVAWDDLPCRRRLVGRWGISTTDRLLAALVCLRISLTMGGNAEALQQANRYVFVSVIY